MNAILSRCSLLDALAGCIEPSGVRGTILVDGRKRPKNFRFMTGYVLQVTAIKLEAIQRWSAICRVRL